VIELFSLGVEASNGKCVLIHEAYFVPQISAFVHNRKSLPLTRLDINLFYVGRKTTAKTTTENNDFVRLRAKACTIR
jgi:hypothetical protein